MKHWDLLFRIFDAEYYNFVLEISFWFPPVSDSSLFCVFRNLQKIDCVWTEVSFSDATLCILNLAAVQKKTYLCFSRHASCNPINPLRTNRFMFLEAVSRQFDKSQRAFMKMVLFHTTLGCHGKNIWKVLERKGLRVHNEDDGHIMKPMMMSLPGWTPKKKPLHQPLSKTWWLWWWWGVGGTWWWWRWWRWWWWWWCCRLQRGQWWSTT